MSDWQTDLFHLRRAVARIGSADWLRWWDCHALSSTGDYVVPRLFQRTAELSAAHVAFRAARAEHRRRVPKEELIHLFDLGQTLEGTLERWLIARKGESWRPATDLPSPTPETRGSTLAALAAAGIDVSDDTAVQGEAHAVDAVVPSALDEPHTTLVLARRLAGAYGLSSPGRLVVPFIRLRS